MKAETHLLDHYFEYWMKAISHFYTIENVQSRSVPLNPASKVLSSVKVRLDQKEIIYGRVADTIFSGLESCGGFFESLIHIGMVIVFFFQERLFKRSFLRQLYQVDAEVIPESI